MTQAQNSNASELYIAPQGTAGQVGSPSFTLFPTTSGRLNKTVSYVKSQTIKSDGQSTVNIRDAVTNNSEFAFEVSRDIQLIMASALRINDDADLVSVTGNTISFNASGNTISDSGDGFANILPNSFVFVTGATNTALNREYWVTAATAGVLTVSSGQIAADEAAGASITVAQRVMRSGNTANYLVLQERENDTSAPSNDTSYTTQIDGIVNTLNITVGTSGVVTGTAGIVAGQQLDGNDEVSGQSTTSTVQRQPLSNLDMVWLPDQNRAAVQKFTEVTMDISSNSEAIQAAGVEGALCNTINTISVTGNLNSITVITAPREELNRQQSGTTFAISYLFNFENGEKMAITKLQVRYTEGSRERTTDTVANFSGTYDAETGANGATLQVDFNY